MAAATAEHMEVNSCSNGTVYENANSTIDIISNSDSLGSDEYLLGFEPTTLRPVVQRLRPDPRELLLASRCRSETILRPCSSESSDGQTAAVYQQQVNVNDDDLAQKLAAALASPTVAAVMRQHVSSGLAEFVQNRIEPLEARVEQLTQADRFHQSKTNENSDQIQALDQRIKSIEEKIKSSPVPIVHKTKYIPPQNAMKANNVIISGIPEDKEEGTDKVDDKINALLNNLEVTVSNFQAKRIGKESTSKSRPILVELANPWEKRKIYSARLNLRNKGLNNIFINEDLDKRQAEIYFHTRRAKKNNHIAKTWTIGGTVHIMKFGQNTPIPVECLEELSTLLPNFKITEPRSKSNDETTKSKWSAAISREKTETCLITQKLYRCLHWQQTSASPTTLGKVVPPEPTSGNNRLRNVGRAHRRLLFKLSSIDKANTIVIYYVLFQYLKRRPFMGIWSPYTSFSRIKPVYLRAKPSQEL